jgi:hypothetical protein
MQLAMAVEAIRKAAAGSDLECKATKAFVDGDFKLAELYIQAIMTRDPNLSTAQPSRPCPLHSPYPPLFLCIEFYLSVSHSLSAGNP